MFSRPYSSSSIDFNQRTREECDHKTTAIFFFLDYFNQRTREECDLKMAQNVIKLDISINAPVKSATTKQQQSFSF